MAADPEEAVCSCTTGLGTRRHGSHQDQAGQHVADRRRPCPPASMRRLVRCDEDDSTFDELSASVSFVGPPVSPRCSTEDHVHSTSVPSSSVPVPSYSGPSHQATADSTPGAHDVRDGGQESTSSWSRAERNPAGEQERAAKELPGWVAQRKTGEHQARELKTQEFVRKRSMALGSSTAAGGRKGDGPPGNQNLAEALARAPSLSKQNWAHKTFQDLNRGLLPNLLQRVITYGMYFPLEQMWTSLLLQRAAGAVVPDAPVLLVAPLAGQLTGATSGLVTNYLSLVKYRQYQRDIQKPLLHDVRRIFYKDLATLTRGLGATVARDSVFGSVFTSLRVLF